MRIKRMLANRFVRLIRRCPLPKPRNAKGRGFLSRLLRHFVSFALQSFFSDKAMETAQGAPARPVQHPHLDRANDIFGTDPFEIEDLLYRCGFEDGIIRERHKVLVIFHEQPKALCADTRNFIDQSVRSTQV
jgi:hypothetical protein